MLCRAESHTGHAGLGRLVLIKFYKRYAYVV